MDSEFPDLRLNELMSDEGIQTAMRDDILDTEER